MLTAKQAKLVKAVFECMPAFPPSHACIVMDLTPIATIDRRVGWTYPSPLRFTSGVLRKARAWSRLLFLVDRRIGFPSQCLGLEGPGFSPLGKTE